MSKIHGYKKLSEYKPLDVRWLWKNLIACDMVNIVEGDPDVGKSYFLMYLAAQLSIGGKLPDGTKLDQQDVVYCTVEDHNNYTVRPRIDAMGGDPDSIHVQEKFEPFSDRGLKYLENLCDEYAPGLIIVDTLYGFVPDKVDMYKPNQIRSWLSKLNDIANRYGNAIVVIRHLIKTKHSKAIYQGSGSMDVLGVVRSALLVTHHPDEEGVRVLAHLKHNLAPRQKSWLYKIVEKANLERPVIEWLGQSDLTVEELSTEQKAPTELDRAIEFLNDQLENGAKPSDDVVSKAEAYSITKRTLDRAKNKLGITSKKKGKIWFMSLPTAE